MTAPGGQHEGKGQEGLPRGRHGASDGRRQGPAPPHQHLPPEHRDCHPRLCPSMSPAFLPSSSRHIVVFWGQVPHQTGFWAQSMTHQGSQGLSVPSSSPSQPDSHQVRAAARTSFYTPRCPRPHGITLTAFPAVPSRGWRLSQPVSGYLT